MTAALHCMVASAKHMLGEIEADGVRQATKRDAGTLNTPTKPAKQARATPTKLAKQARPKLA